MPGFVPGRRGRQMPGSGSSRKGARVARDVVPNTGPRNRDDDGVGPPAVPTVLVVVPDPARGGEIVGALQRRGFPALLGATAEDALHWARREPPSLALID